MFKEGGEIRMEEHTNKIVISKRSEDTIEFDTSKIVEAISKIMDLFAGIGGMVKEMIDEAAKSFYAAMHEFCHWLMGGFFFGRRKEKKYNVIPGWISVVALAPCVLSQKIKFYNYSCILRDIYLLRSQDRGTTDSSDVNGYTTEYLIAL